MQNHLARFGALAVASAALATATLSTQASLLYATNGTTVSRFDDATLGTVTTVPITGLQAGETIVGIDVRPQAVANTQILYGLGSTSRLYTINPLTGASVPVGAGAFTPALNGTAFGIDFNPTVDRLRVVSNTEQNFRLNPDTGAVAATDTALSPAGNIVSVAYDRNFDDSGVPTTLFGIDSAAGTLVTIGGVNGTPSPNAGAITTVGSLGLGTNLNEAIGFDIAGDGTPGTAFATITTGGISRLYTVNLSTGTATLRGQIGLGGTPFLGLASAVVPEPSAIGAGVIAGALLLRRRRRDIGR